MACSPCFDRGHSSEGPRTGTARESAPLIGRGRGKALRALGLLALGLALGSAALALGPHPARASVVLALSLEDLTRKADVIVLGVPTEHQSRRGIDGKLIVTDVSMKVETALKGNAKAGDTLVATLLGGRIGDLALQVPGEASLPIGQRVIVFLYRSPASGDLRVVGMAQGVLALAQRGGGTMVLPGGGGAELVAPDAQGQVQDAAAAMSGPVPLGDLLDRIRQLVAR